MPTLITNLSTGKGTWGHVGRLIEDQSFEKIFIITNEYGKENFNKNDKCEFITIDPNRELKEVRDEIQSALKNKIKETEVAVNIISGTGKEHMASISALLKLGMGIRLIALTKEGIEEI